MRTQKTKQQQLEELAHQINNLKTCTVIYKNGHGYFLQDSYGGKHVHTVAWFATFQIGWKWLQDYKATGRPNFANLRVGRSRVVELAE